MVRAEAPACNVQSIRHRPITSAYLVMLRRFQSVLHDENSPQAASLDAKPASEYVESTVAIKQLLPIFSELEKALGHRAFGIDIGRYMHPSDYGIFGYAMMNCPTIGLSLENAARLKSFRNQNMTASAYRTGGSFNYQINLLDADDALEILVELDLSTAFQFGKLLVGPHREHLLQLESVCFKHSPLGPVEIYEERFGCPVYFNQERYCATLAEEVTQLPVYGANPKILSTLERKIVTMMSRNQVEEQSLSDRVNTLLCSYPLDQLPTATQIAQNFNMSLSSLKKNLREEGSCYQGICEDVKKEKSFKLLMQKDLPIKAIAFELGFANPSAFNKAFKRWTGESPLGYRKART